MTLLAIFTTPQAVQWQSAKPKARILHLFEAVVNLIAEDGAILSLVTEEIGPGPFSVVVPASAPFTEQIEIDDPILVSSHMLRIGRVVVETGSARVWSPRPHWEKLRSAPSELLSDLEPLKRGIRAARSPSLRMGRQMEMRLRQGFEQLLAAVRAGSLPQCRSHAADLAGAGIGLTPSGDDLLMGVIFALWAAPQADVLGVFAHEIADSAAARTTSLSGAWLRAAVRGEAVQSWHVLADAMTSRDGRAIQSAATQILSIGHSSGLEALTGFVFTLEMLLSDYLSALA